MKVSFSDAEAEAWGGLLRTYALLDQAIDADLRRHDGVRHVEFEVLLRLARAPEGRLRINDIAGSSLLSRSGTSRLVERLVKLGLVEREAASEDGRGAYAVLTPAGRKVFEQITPRHLSLVRSRFIDRLTADEITALGRIWDKLLAPPE